MTAHTLRTQRLRSPHALLAFLGISALGSGAAALGYVGEAGAANGPLWRDGAGTPVVSGDFDPRRSLAPLVKEIGPTVVNVRSYGKSHPSAAIEGTHVDPRALPFLEMAPQQPRNGIGSGVVLSSDGLVVTNHHVVDGAERIEVKLHDGRMFNARVLGSDPLTDIALVQLEGARDLKVATLGASATMAVGDWVLAIGSPMGLEQTATTGIVSAKGRGSLGLYANSYIDFLQTDASIAPGSSGGPLFNMNGEVIGINTAIGGLGRGLGFAVPIDQAKTVIPQLKSAGKVVRGWLGISGQDFVPAVGRAPETGAVIGAVMAGTPAAKAGLQPGDRILAVDGHELTSFGDLRGRIADLKPGSVANFKLTRKDQPLALKVTVGQLPGDDELRRLGQRQPGDGRLFPEGPPRLGLEVEPSADGLEVRAVRPGSLAEELGVRPGDRLQSVNGKAVKNAADIGKALSADRGRVEVKVMRGKATHSAVIERR